MAVQPADSIAFDSDQISNEAAASSASPDGARRCRPLAAQGAGVVPRRPARRQPVGRPRRPGVDGRLGRRRACGPRVRPGRVRWPGIRAVAGRLPTRRRRLSRGPGPGRVGAGLLCRCGHGRGRRCERPDGGRPGRHPTGDGRRQPAGRGLHGRRCLPGAGREAGGGLRRAARRADGHAGAADQRDARGPERPHRVPRGRAAPSGPDRRRGGDRDRGLRATADPRGAGGAAHRHVPPGQLHPHYRQGQRLAGQRGGLQFDNTGKNGHSAPFSWAA
jgi:hypothetical protein